MAYIMQVKVYDKIKKCNVWGDVKTSEGKVYKYKTEEEAIKMLNICYPENAETRTIKI
jgi:hypothetical protein